jgi:hypothetical protein
MTLRGEKVAEVAELLAKFNEHKAVIEQFSAKAAELYDVAEARPALTSPILSITKTEIEGILRARIAETARLLENVGIKVELPA